jgi:ABC-type glycerol-3-phosphate transport system substrate-binding protein
MQLRKTVSVLLAIIMSFNIGACSCASKKTNNNIVRLTMWGAEEDQQMYRRMADRFIEANKGEANITIEIGVQSE